MITGSFVMVTAYEPAMQVHTSTELMGMTAMVSLATRVSL